MSPLQRWAAALALAASAALSCHVSQPDARSRPARAPLRPGLAALPVAVAAEALALEPDWAPLADLVAARSPGLEGTEALRVAEAIADACAEHGVREALVLAVIQVESNFDPYAVSSMGAMGLMQILPGTGQALAEAEGVAWNGPRTLFDPATNVRLGVAYLGELRASFAHLPTALAAYNVGPGAIRGRLRRGEPVPARYARRVLAILDDAPELAVATSS